MTCTLDVPTHAPLSSVALGFFRFRFLGALHEYLDIMNLSWLHEYGTVLYSSTGTPRGTVQEVECGYGNPNFTKDRSGPPAKLALTTTTTTTVLLLHQPAL